MAHLNREQYIIVWTRSGSSLYMIFSIENVIEQLFVSVTDKLWYCRPFTSVETADRKLLFRAEKNFEPLFVVRCGEAQPVTTYWRHKSTWIRQRSCIIITWRLLQTCHDIAKLGRCVRSWIARTCWVLMMSSTFTGRHMVCHCYTTHLQWHHLPYVCERCWKTNSELSYHAFCENSFSRFSLDAEVTQDHVAFYL